MRPVQVDDTVRSDRIGDDGLEIEGRALAAERRPRAGQIDAQAAGPGRVARDPDEAARQETPPGLRGARGEPQERRVDDEQAVVGGEAADRGAEPAENRKGQDDAGDAGAQ